VTLSQQLDIPFQDDGGIVYMMRARIVSSRRVKSFVVWALTFSLLGGMCTPVDAETPFEDLQQVPNVEVKVIPSRMAELLGVPANSPIIQQIIDGTLRRRGLERKERERQTKVIKHVKGEKGRPLTLALKPLNLGENKLPKENPNPHIIKEYREREEKARERFLFKHGFDQPKDPLKIRNCPGAESSSEKLQTSVEVSGKDQEIRRNVLFLHEIEAKRIKDPEETFGKSVSIITISEDNLIGKMQAIPLQVTCLPYRYIVTQDHNIRHSGKAALKNYDADPLSTGEWSGDFGDKFLD